MRTNTLPILISFIFVSIVPVSTTASDVAPECYINARVKSNTSDIENPEPNKSKQLTVRVLKSSEIGSLFSGCDVVSQGDVLKFRYTTYSGMDFLKTNRYLKKNHIIKIEYSTYSSLGPNGDVVRGSTWRIVELIEPEQDEIIKRVDLVSKKSATSTHPNTIFNRITSFVFSLFR